MSLRKFTWVLHSSLFLSTLFCTQAFSQEQPLGWRYMRIYIVDIAGQPISGAEVIIGDISIERTDFQGMVRIESRPGLHLPAYTVIRAEGFQTRHHLLEASLRESVSIVLERINSRTLPAGKGVSVSEMSPANRKAAVQLHDQALDAIRNADYNTAEQLLRKVVELSPSTAATYNNLAVVSLRQGRLGQSAAWFEKALEVEPLNHSSMGNLGIIRRLQDRREESFQLLDRAISMGFVSPMAQYLHGLLSLEKGLWKQAVAQLRLVRPDRFAYRDLFLAAAYSRLGQEKPARKSFRKFIERNPVNFIVHIEGVH